MKNETSSWFSKKEALNIHQISTYCQHLTTIAEIALSNMEQRGVNSNDMRNCFDIAHDMEVVVPFSCGLSRVQIDCTL
jgi:hypothetical protein